MVGNHEPATVYLLIDIGCDGIDRTNGAVLRLRLPGLDADLPREIAIDVDLRVREGD